jgi:hypothetical protein
LPVMRARFVGGREHFVVKFARIVAGEAFVHG